MPNTELKPASQSDAARVARSHRLVALWLLGVCLLIGAMVVVGGATRLTESGLSITEWRPITGAVPPLSQADWEAEFAKYRQIPEYQLINKGMSLDDFKAIYWWEWGHRLLGRLIGFAFLLPMIGLAVAGHIERALVPRLGALFVLGGAQGALGWWMVASGLTERVDVSQYRLAAHLGLAFLIFGAIFWTALGLTRAPAAQPAPPPLRRAAYALSGLIFVQILAGALVAGLRAGHIYNTWPAMDGGFAPRDYFFKSPWFVNLFENQAAVQFNHRILAYLVTACVIAFWIWVRRTRKDDILARKRTNMLVAMVGVQVALGIWTLLAVVPVWLGLLHQAGALGTFAASLYLSHGLSGRAWTARKPLPADAAALA